MPQTKIYDWWSASKLLSPDPICKVDIFENRLESSSFSTPSRPFRKSQLKRIPSVLLDDLDYSYCSMEASCASMEDLFSDSLRNPSQSFLTVKKKKTVVSALRDWKPARKKQKKSKALPRKKSNEKACAKKITSRYIGVCWNKNNKKWQAQIYLPKKDKTEKAKYKYLGLYSSESDAGRSYDNMLKKLKGANVSPHLLNFPSK